jgi:hypothetical protein
MPHTPIERADAQAGTRDDAGTPALSTLLFALLGGATAWSLHLLASYTLLAYACSSGWGGVRTALVAISLLALGMTAWSGVVARRRWRVARAIDRPEDDAWDARMGEGTARVSFLMVTGLALSLIFALGIVYEAVTIFLAPLCAAGVWS